MLQKTPLYDLHVSLGGKMVPFAGYDMPVQYDGMGVLKEHLHTRAAVGLFDVSHMGQAVLSGDVGALEKIVPSDIKNLEAGKTRYTVLLNENGGIIDDLMVTRWDENTLYLVVNAACKDKDFAYIKKNVGADLDILENRALLALQGPKAEDVLKKHFPAVTGFPFMTSFREGDFYVSRSGYTGEDGFEISVPDDKAVEFAKDLLAHEDVKFIGLGARDSLRLEAGLCLYGHDIDDTTTPAEANIKWVIQKRRREAADFPAAAKILNDKPQRLRIGIAPEGKAPVREGTELFSGDKKIGVVTSGGFGPTADAPIAMGYVEAAFAAPDTKITAMVRGTPRPCTIVPLPFVEHKYRKQA